MELIGHPLLRNYPGNIDTDIEWHYISKEDYMEMESILTEGVTFFDPFIIDNFYPQDMFDELVSICNSFDLSKIDYSNQMNKWEQVVNIPQKFIDYAVNKIRDALGTSDIHYAYHMYAHHQITSEGRVPKLPLHIDWAPGAYMVDLHIGGNRDWGFVARYENFITKPNQAVICQPQFDFHYRPKWNSQDTDEYYQALFFHLVNRNNWSIPNESIKQNRSDHLNSKYNFGIDFRETEIFKNFQEQRNLIFNRLYTRSMMAKGLPLPPWDEIPSEQDTNIHQRKGVIPANNINQNEEK
jgi:hypothetical protein